MDLDTPQKTQLAPCQVSLTKAPEPTPTAKAWADDRFKLHASLGLGSLPCPTLVSLGKLEEDLKLGNAPSGNLVEVWNLESFQTGDLVGGTWSHQTQHSYEKLVGYIKLKPETVSTLLKKKRYQRDLHH